MTQEQPCFRVVWIEVVLVLLSVLLALFVRYHYPVTARLASNFESQWLDARFTARGEWPRAAIEQAKKQVVLVAIDDAATNRYGRVLPRKIHARLVQKLEQAGARAIVFDLIFSDAERAHPAADVEFARAIRQAGNVFLPFDNHAAQVAPPPIRQAMQEKLSYPVSLPTPPQQVHIQPPVAPLFQAMRGGGHVIAQPDSDRVFRSSALLYEAGAVYPHIMLDAVARQVWKLNPQQESTRLELDDDFLQIGTHRIGPLQRQPLRRSLDGSALGTTFTVALDFPGGHNVMQEFSVPYLDVLEGRAGERLKGRVVLIGETATGTTDLRPGPFDGQHITRGVETNLTLLLDLLDNRFLQPVSLGWAIASTLLCALLAGFAAASRPAWALAAALSTLLVYGLLAFLLFALDNLVLEMTAPMLAVFISFAVLSVYRTGYVDHAARRYEDASRAAENVLSLHRNEDILRELRRNPQRRLALQNGLQREVTILVCGIHNFEEWRKTQPPDEIKARLDEYFSLLCEVAQDDYSGFIHEIRGGELRVLWNAFSDQPNHAAQAVRAAISMQRALAVLNTGWHKQKQTEFHIGIGIATGEIMLGSFGSPHHRMLAGVLGDCVTLAESLQRATQECNSTILAAREMHDAAPEDGTWQALGALPLHGLDEPQEVYAVGATA